MTRSVRWSTQGCDFYTNPKFKVGIVIPKLYATKIITWNFHVDDLQGNHKYNMMLGRDILSEPKIDLRFSNNIIRGNGGAYTGCKYSIKDVTNINFNVSPTWIHDKSFQNE